MLQYSLHRGGCFLFCMRISAVSQLVRNPEQENCKRKMLSKYGSSERIVICLKS
jgi:hypothetical protein